MDKSSLLERKTFVESKYNSLQKQSNDIGIEMRRLEGEFRLLEQQIKDYKESEDDPIKKGK